MTWEIRQAAGQFPAVRNPNSRRLPDGFTLLEMLVSIALLAVVAAGSFALLASAKQLAQKPSFRTEAVYYAGETLETLRDYVTTQTGDPEYQLAGDPVVPPYALTPDPGHTHALPAGTFKDTLGGTRTYTVTDIDLDSAFDSDGDGDPTNDVDYKKVTVTIQWTEQQ